jgi:peroxiredoxin family protein
MADKRLSQLSIVVYDGHYDKIHYALAMASAAAAIDTPVTLFFTMDAARSIMKPDDIDGEAAWRGLAVSQGNGNGGAMDDGFAADKIGTFEELLSACMDFGVTFMVCDMGLKARGLSANNLRDDIPVTSGGLVTFLSNANADGSVVFI